MIQKFTCVPKTDYDVLIVTNGTVSQVESKLDEINRRTNDEIPSTACITYLDNFSQLLSYLDKHNKVFQGKVLFMFFNGLEYIQDFISDLIDHFNRCSIFCNPYIQNDAGIKHHKGMHAIERLENAYFYFDSSVSDIKEVDYDYDFHFSYPYNLSESSENLKSQFNSVITIINDVLKKISFMTDRIRGVYIDDVDLPGEKVYPLRCLIRNFPQVESINLTSHNQLLMNDLF